MKDQTIFKSEEGRQKILSTYNAILKRWPVPYEEFYIPTRQGNTFVLACGDKSAEPLILIHGSSSNSAMWIGDIPDYIKNYRVYAVDIPGEPGKSEAIRHDLSGDAYAEWMEQIFTFLNIEQACLTGISLGGWMCLKFATEYPENVKKLVLLCPAGVAPQKMSFMLKVIPFMLLGQWGKGQIIKIVNGYQNVPEEAIRYSMLISDHFNPIMEMIPIFSDEKIQCLTMPTLLIVGKKDALLPSIKTAERLKILLPNLKEQILQNKGHVLINMSEEILAFLND